MPRNTATCCCEHHRLLMRARVLSGSPSSHDGRKSDKGTLTRRVSTRGLDAQEGPAYLRCRDVAMMQSAESGQRLNVAWNRRPDRNWPPCWRILCQPEMRPVLMVVADVFRHQPLQMPLVEGRLRGRADLVGNFPPNVPQRRSATDCERRCGRARFPCLWRTTLRRCRTSRRGRTAGIDGPACTARPLAAAARSKVRPDFA